MPAGLRIGRHCVKEALADRVQNHVVGLVVLGEVLAGVVDDPIRAETRDPVQILPAADGRHGDPEVLQQLDRRRADGSGRAVDEDVLPAGDLRAPDLGEGVVRALGAGRGLRVRHVRRHGRHGAVLRDGQVLGMRAERSLAVPEHPLADGERRDVPANRLDHSGVLVPENRRARPAEPGEQPHEEGLGGPARTVGPVHRRGPDLDTAHRGVRGSASPPQRSEPPRVGRTPSGRRPAYLAP